ncbi:MAG TPA: hypothetical protein VFG83_10205 [Kofleriaceae bacterium]|nr:hypothetical protein [Kofleriaceae bacterium]
MRTLAYVAASAALIFCFGTGCGGGGEEDLPDADGPPTVNLCDEAVNHSDLAWIQTNIFTKSCALSASCHTGDATAAGGLSLDEGMAEANLIDQPSDLFPDWKLVVPGDSSMSYITVILTGESAGPIDPDIGTMPYNSGQLCPEKVDAIARWIDTL